MTVGAQDNLSGGTFEVVIQDPNVLTQVLAITAAGEAKVSVTQPIPSGSNVIGNIRIDQTTPGTTNGVQVNASLPSGANIIGNVRIDQTTPGSTNGVQVNAALPTGANVIGAVTQSGTWTVQPGNTANTTPWLVTTGSSGSNVNIRDGAGNALTSTTSGATTSLHVLSPDTITGSTALGALNATISISMQGLSSAGFQLNAGTLIGTIIPEASVDGGTNWTATQFYLPSNQSITPSIVFAAANTQRIVGIVGFPGISNVRVRVSAYTSGTANAQLRTAAVSGSSPSTTISAAFATSTTTYPAVTSGVVTQIIAANTSRKYLAIGNNGNQTARIQFGTGTGLTATTGLPILSNTYYEFKGDNLYTGPIFLIVAGTIAITVTEGTP